MIIKEISLSGFRGFSKNANVSFGEQFTIITGRNGTGKSSICDAIEFAITGELRRYTELGPQRKKEADEYLWWRGPVKATERKVELTLLKENGERVCFSRDHKGRLSGVSEDNLREIVSRSANTELSEISLSQLLRATLIRDEQISELSLDLADRARFTFVSSVLGMYDISPYIKTIASAEKKAKQSLEKIRQELEEADETLFNEKIRLNTLIKSADSPTAVAASEKLREILKIDQMTRHEVVQEATDALRRMNQIAGTLNSFTQRASNQHESEHTLQEHRAKMTSLEEQSFVDNAVLEGIEAEIAEYDNPESVSRLQLEIAELGKELGLVDECLCPLCGSEINNESFEKHLNAVTRHAENLAAKLSRRIDLKSAIALTERHIKETRSIVEDILKEKSLLESDWSEFQNSLESIPGFPDDRVDKYSREKSAPTDAKNIVQIISNQSKVLLDLISEIGDTAAPSSVTRHQERIEQLTLNRDILEMEIESQEKAYKRLSEDRRAAQRLSGRFLDQRLIALDPLLTELYKRLKPHSSWDSIRTHIRGDVQHSLGLMVNAGGESVNPSYIFSSGQRRAAGLAFLIALAVSNSSLNLNTVVFDDPVQHVDDYRALHLVETLAAIAKTGKQVICTVEDPALAKLMARRIPCDKTGGGSVIEMAFNSMSGAQLKETKFVHPSNYQVLEVG